jgi:tripeptidyl-peptidase I
MSKASRLIANLLVIIELFGQRVCLSNQAFQVGGTRDLEPSQDFIDTDRINGQQGSMHVFREASKGLSVHPDVIKGPRVLSTQLHSLIFVVPLRNMEKLTDVLHDVSDPMSGNYGKHLTKQEIDDLTSNPASHQEVVAYLKAAGVTVTLNEFSGECISAQAPIGLWERLLDTEFYSYSFESEKGGEHSKYGLKEASDFIRTEKYSVPAGLHMHVESVLNTVQLPMSRSDRLPLIRVENSEVSKSTHFSEKSNKFPGYTTPQLLNEVYNIDDNTGHPRATQAAYEAADQLFCPEDLTKFQKFYGLPVSAVNRTIGNKAVSTATCASNFDLCAESNLDIMYLLSMADTPTYHYVSPYANMGLWLQFLVNSGSTPPLIISISYAQPESLVSVSDYTMFQNNAIKLGVLGTTILASAGDDGVSSSGARVDKNKCSYVPIFPASSPYVTSVGATKVE